MDPQVLITINSWARELEEWVWVGGMRVSDHWKNLVVRIGHLVNGESEKEITAWVLRGAGEWGIIEAVKKVFTFIVNKLMPPCANC